MPTYQYLCESCGLDFEHYQSFTDDTVPTCPNRGGGGCKSRGKGKVRKVLTAPSITFKGSGFYKNDSRSGSSSGASSTSSDTSSSDAKSSDSSSDSSKSTADSSTSDSKKSDTKKSDAKSSSKSSSSGKKAKASK